MAQDTAPNTTTPQSLQVGSAIPTGATIGTQDNGGLSVGSPIPQGATIGDSSQNQETDLQKFTQGLEAPQTDPVLQIEQPISNAIAGGVKEAGNVAGNLLDMITRHGTRSLTPFPPQVIAESYKKLHPDATPEQVSDFVNKQTNAPAPFSKQTQEAVQWLHSAGQPEGFWEHVGAVGEQALEWLGADGILKLASAPVKAGEAVQAVDTAGHIAQAQQVSKVLKANPKLAGILAIGLKASRDALAPAAENAIKTGVQNYAHTEDSGSAAKATALGGVISYPAEALSSGLENVADEIGNLAPKKVTVAGQNIPVATTHPEAVDQLSDIGNRVKGYSTPEGAQNFVDTKVQPAARKALQNNFSDSALNSVNELRDIRGENLHTEHPVLRTLSGTAKFMSQEAKKTYQKLDDVAQKDIDEWTDKYGKDAENESANEGSKIVDQYGNPVKSETAVTDISEKPKLFTELQDQINDAKDTIKSKQSTQVAKQTAIEELPKYEKEMSNFMNAHPDVVNQDELDAANSVYSQSKRYGWLAKKVRSATMGSGEGNVFKGDTLKIRPQALENLEKQYDNQFGEGKFKELLGDKAYNSFNDIVNTLKTPKTGDNFTKWLNEAIPLHAGKIFTIPVGSFADRLLFDPQIAKQVMDKFQGLSNAASKAGKSASALAGTQVRPNHLATAMQGTQSDLSQ